MPPAGFNAIAYGLDTMTSSNNEHVSLSLKPRLAISSPPTKESSLTESQFDQSTVRSDHDYHTKSDVRLGHRMVTDVNDNYCDSLYTEDSDCEMLSSYAVDQEKMTGEETDTDFLKDLDDLNFNLHDSCCDVAMEDSFQQFIDSALDQSYVPFCYDMDENIPTHDGNNVVMNKEQFLAMLNLRSMRDQQEDLRQPSSSSSQKSSSTNPIDQASLHPSNNQLSKNVSSYDGVPTRQCSCVDTVIKAVYSTAQPHLQECVRTCPSNLVTTSSNENNGHKEFTQNKRTNTKMSLLFINTQSTSNPKSCLDLASDEVLWRIQTETTDIMKWLNESQDHFGYNNGGYFNNNNNIVNETISNKHSTLFNMESFVDFDSFETDIMDNREELVPDVLCQRPVHQTQSNTTSPCVSRLKLSLLSENFSTKHRHSSISDLNPEGSHAEQFTPTHLDLSNNSYSPSWSRSESIQSAISPHPLSSMDILWTLNNDDVADDMNKSPFALLNLFSDENATSLLHTDSIVPDIRFM